MESVRQLEGRWLARGILVAVLAGFSAVTGAQTAGQVAPPPADLEPGVNTSATQPERSATETQWRESHEAPTVRRGGGNPEKRQGRDAGQPSSPEPAAAQPKPAQTTTKPATAAGRAAAASGTRQSAGATSASQDAPAGDSLANRSVAGATRGTGVTDAPPAAPSAASDPSGNASTAAPSAAAAGAAGTHSTVPKSGATAAATGPAGKAHDSLQLDTTQITGNRELPKVLYIVPWKRSDLGDLVGKPVNSLLDEVLTPVDRDVFKRQNRYYDALKPDATKDGAGAAAGADVKH